MLQDKFVVIDLHGAVVQEDIILLNGKEILERAVERQGSYIPCDTDLLLILVLHNIIGKREIQTKHATIIKRLLQTVSPTEIRDSIRSSELSNIILYILEQLKIDQADARNIADTRNQLINYYRRSKNVNSFRTLKRKYWLWRRRYRLRPRAPLYALTGVDGVGKSTLTSEILNVMNQPGGFPAMTIYMGPWGHYKLARMGGELFVPGWSVDMREWLTCIFRQTRLGRSDQLAVWSIIRKTILRDGLSKTDVDNYAYLRTRSSVFVTARFFRSVFAAARFMVFLTAEMYYRYYLAYRQRRRGVTVIADRYIYDLMTGRMHELIPQYRRIRKFICWLFPKPDAVFLLHNDPDVILERKADLTRPTLLKYLELYEQLAIRHDFTRVKTNEPAKVLAQRIISSRFGEIIQYIKS